MGARGAVNVIHRRDIAASDNPDEERTRLIDDYEERFANPYVAAERGFVDDVIEPRGTRPHLIRSLDMLRSKREAMPPKKHGNIPL
jgi:propionyl-CoA carboxylase beta chain